MGMSELRAEIKSVLEEELGALLRDVSWRLRHMTDLADKVSAEQLNLNTHMLTGYVVASDSPSAGSIEWDDLHVVYQGTQYGPYAGNTAMKYVWFDADHATQKIQTTNTKPTLTADDAILFVNNGGTVVEVLKSQLIDGALLIDGTVNGSELADAAVTAGKIFDGAVTSTKIGDNAVTGTKILDGAVGGTKITDGAVTSTKIGENAVTSTAIASGAVGSTEINDGAVTTTKIGATAVDSTKLADGAVSTTKLADDAVTTAKIGSGAVGTTEIADGAVGGAKISSGGVDTSKLNTLMHMIF